MSNYTNKGIYSEMSVKNITQRIQNHLLIFWEKNKNLNSLLERPINYKQYEQSYIQFTEHIATEFKDVLGIQNFLVFWANILIKEAIREKYRAPWHPMIAMLIQ